MTRVARSSVWCTAAVLVVLATRTIAYALTPQPTALSLELERSAGGPRLVVVSVVALGCASVATLAVVAFAALAVRERLTVERSLVVSPPRVRPLRLAARAALLFATTAAAFALLESYLHWRAGLGWHGLHCLVGPLHRDALPILAALSLVAGGVIEAIEHLAAWARRTFARLLRRPRPLSSPIQRRRPIDRTPRAGWLGAAMPARGPPFEAARALAATAAADI